MTSTIFFSSSTPSAIPSPFHQSHLLCLLCYYINQVLPWSSKIINPPRDAEKSELYASLAKCKSKLAILSLSKDHLESYIPLSLCPTLPSPLPELHDTEYLTWNYIELLRPSEKVMLSITPDQCDAVEKNAKSAQIFPLVSHENRQDDSFKAQNFVYVRWSHATTDSDYVLLLSRISTF